MVRLGVNIDHVATIRQARRTYEPDPVWAAAQAQLGGADNITLHLREDRRHIQDEDVRRVRQATPILLNMELATVDAIIAIACAVKPDSATLVPERREEVTTEGGLDVIRNEAAVKQATARLRDGGMLVSLFIDADVDQVDASAALHAQAVEFHTGRYAEAKHGPDCERELFKLVAAARHAHTKGLHVHMGHGLNYHNVQPVAAIPQVEELNIGHSIVSRAVFVGLAQAVREMKELMRTARK
jgi:pyridoxine 5-phosphate synthase